MRRAPEANVMLNDMINLTVARKQLLANSLQQLSARRSMHLVISRVYKSSFPRGHHCVERGDAF